MLFFSFSARQGGSPLSRSTEELSTRTNWERITQHSHNTFTVHTTLTQPNLSQPFRPVCNPLPRPNPLQPSHSPTHTTALSDSPTLTLRSPSHTLPRLPLQSAPFQLLSPLYDRPTQKGEVKFTPTVRTVSGHLIRPLQVATCKSFAIHFP